MGPGAWIVLRLGASPGPPAGRPVGSDGDRHDRARPRYPDALVAALAGRGAVDARRGTAMAALQLRPAAGCSGSIPMPDGDGLVPFWPLSSHHYGAIMAPWN